MENLAHTLVGAAIGRAGLQKKSPMAMPALLIAANLPDIDIFGGAFGQHYLDFHRGITHAAGGMVLLSVGLAALLWGARRLRRGRDRPARFWPLWYLSLIGLLTHPLLDYLNDYGVRPWLPLSERRYYGDLLAIVDPWIWLILGCALYLVTRERAWRAAWMALAALLGGLIAFAGSFELLTAWLLLLPAAIVAGKYLRGRGIHPARIGLVVLLAYFGSLAAVRLSVVHAARAHGPQLVSEPVGDVAVLPARPGSRHLWTVVMEGPERFHVADVRLQDWSTDPPRFSAFRKNLDDPCYLASLSERDMAAMSRFARFPSVSVSHGEGGCTVILRDLRYRRTGDVGWGIARVVLPAWPSHREVP